jgi:hypothetical protein
VTIASNLRVTGAEMEHMPTCRYLFEYCLVGCTGTAQPETADAALIMAPLDRWTQPRPMVHGPDVLVIEPS